MTDEQYQRLCRYLAITRLPVTTYFRKLIKEATIHARMPRQKIDPHPAVNHIYSNIRQIARCPRARELAPEQIAQLEFLADKLCWDQQGVPPFYEVLKESLAVSLEKASLDYIEYVMGHGMILHPHSWLLAARADLKNKVQGKAPAAQG